MKVLILTASLIVSGCSIFAANQKEELSKDWFFVTQRHKTFIPVVAGSLAYTMLENQNHAKTALAVGTVVSVIDSEIIAHEGMKNNVNYVGTSISAVTATDKLAMAGIVITAIGVKMLYNSLKAK